MCYTLAKYDTMTNLFSSVFVVYETSRMFCFLDNING